MKKLEVEDELFTPYKEVYLMHVSGNKVGVITRYNPLPKNDLTKSKNTTKDFTTIYMRYVKDIIDLLTQVKDIAQPYRLLWLVL